MATIELKVTGSRGGEEVRLPTRTPISTLVPMLLELGIEDRGDPAAPAPVWGIRRSDDTMPLPEERTLEDLAVEPGEELVLVNLRSSSNGVPRPSAMRRQPAPEARVLPRERLSGVLPERLDPWRRFGAAAGAWAGYDDPTAESLEPELLSPREQLTKAKPVGRRRRWHASRRETSYLLRLDRLIVEPSLRRCATIAVMSPKGGVGKTTLTALLGSLFAHTRADRTVAVDANPDFGSLGRTLTPDHWIFVDDLIEVMERPQLTVTELDERLGCGPDGLMVLPAPTDPDRMSALSQETYQSVIASLQRLVGIVLLDCGTGLNEPTARAALEMADQIVLVSDADPSTASLVAESAQLLREQQKPITVVVNKLPRKRSNRLDLDALERHIPYAHAMLEIPEAAHGAAEVAAGTHTWDDAAVSWKAPVRELAVALTSDWARLGVAR